MFQDLKSKLIFLSTVVLTFVSIDLPAHAAGFSVNLDTTQPEGVATNLQILILLTILSVAPSIVLMTTSFTRFIVVLAILRQALGVGQLPPTQILIGLAIIMTFMVMGPTFSEINDTALQPFIHQELTQKEFFEKGVAPLKKFMAAQTHEEEFITAAKLAKIPRPDNLSDIPIHVMVMAYMLNELKIAFKIGFTIFLPFVVIDMIAASALVSIGLMFLPPTTISLPFKIILFVLIDGWNILAEGLVNSYNL